MLTHTTVTFCRQLLAREIQELDLAIHDAEQRKIMWSVYPPNWIDNLDRRVFLRMSARVDKLKERKKKVEDSIRELKAWSWTGNPKELPCEI